MNRTYGNLWTTAIGAGVNLNSIVLAPFVAEELGGYTRALRRETKRALRRGVNGQDYHMTEAQVTGMFPGIRDDFTPVAVQYFHEVYHAARDRRPKSVPAALREQDRQPVTGMFSQYE